MLADAAAKKVCEWHLSSGCCGGPYWRPLYLAVREDARPSAECQVPLLVPGVGAQGGRARKQCRRCGPQITPLALFELVFRAVLHIHGAARLQMHGGAKLGNQYASTIRFFNEAIAAESFEVASPQTPGWEGPACHRERNCLYFHLHD